MVCEARGDGKGRECAVSHSVSARTGGVTGVDHTWNGGTAERRNGVTAELRNGVMSYGLSDDRVTAGTATAVTRSPDNS
jgi:hypothetical protein